jgi:hypothetical protein
MGYPGWQHASLLDKGKRPIKSSYRVPANGYSDIGFTGSAQNRRYWYVFCRPGRWAPKTAQRSSKGGRIVFRQAKMLLPNYDVKTAHLLF